jgi:pyruvate,water dikinase
MQMRLFEQKTSYEAIVDSQRKSEFTNKKVKKGTKRMELAWLGEEACHDLLLVGGKAAHLSRLAARYRVPPGFCLTTEAYTRWATGHDAVGVGLPELRESISNAYQMLAEQCGMAAPGVAVRSSAVDEDGHGASFAGQYDTYLNIVGAEAVAGAVLRCWASSRNERVLAYRREQGLPVDGVRLAVLVQQLVPADASAVAFSANPITGDQGEAVINACWGLGESVVSGAVTPDTINVRKSDMAITTRQVAEKLRMTVAANGAAREVNVPRLLRNQPALTDDQIAEIIRLALALEQETGWPVDVECAYQGNTLYLLQCRPITTLV